MPVTDTSIKAYHETKDLQANQRELVFEYIKVAGCNGTCIADVKASMLTAGIDIEKSSVARAFNDLKGGKAGTKLLVRIQLVNKRASYTTGKTAAHWRVPVKAKETLFEVYND